MPVKSVKTGLVGKLCVKCGQILPLSDFPSNKEWKSQSYHDSWCKECGKKYVNSKEDVVQYCYENNRHWEDSYWEACKRKGQAEMTKTDAIFKASTEAKRIKIAESICAKQWLTLMNNASFYRYEEHDQAVSAALIEGNEPDEEEGKEAEKPVWSKTWRGYYTPSQIAELDETFDLYVSQYGITELNHLDATRKLIKTSYNADIAADRYKRGEITAQEYRQAQAVYTDYSKETMLSALEQGKQQQVVEVDSLGEIIEALESGGFLGENNFQFEPDQIDAVMADFRHTIAAVGQSIGGYE